MISAEDGPVQYEFTYWATPMPGVKDWRKAFDSPAEGENFLVWVGYKAVNTSNPARRRVFSRLRNTKRSSSTNNTVVILPP